MDDERLQAAKDAIADLVEERTLAEMTDSWTVGRLRHELEHLPDEMPLLVNVSAKTLDGQPGFVPINVIGGGFGVSIPDGEGGEHIPSIFSIETSLEPGLIFIDPRDLLA